MPRKKPAPKRGVPRKPLNPKLKATLDAANGGKPTPRTPDSNEMQAAQAAMFSLMCTVTNLTEGREQCPCPKQTKRNSGAYKNVTELWDNQECACIVAARMIHETILTELNKKQVKDLAAGIGKEDL